MAKWKWKRERTKFAYRDSQLSQAVGRVDGIRYVPHQISTIVMKNGRDTYVLLIIHVKTWIVGVQRKIPSTYYYISHEFIDKHSNIRYIALIVLIGWA